jgi:hypothetical protein
MYYELIATIPPYEEILEEEFKEIIDGEVYYNEDAAADSHDECIENFIKHTQGKEFVCDIDGKEVQGTFEEIYDKFGDRKHNIQFELYKTPEGLIIKGAYKLENDKKDVVIYTFKEANK